MPFWSKLNSTFRFLQKPQAFSCKCTAVMSYYDGFERKLQAASHCLSFTSHKGPLRNNYRITTSAKSTVLPLFTLSK